MEVASEPPRGPMTLAQQARREFIRYFAIAAYLFVCFGAVLFYKSAILRAHGIEFAAFGLAFAKALILGKFVLFAEALKFGERVKPGRVVLIILWKALLFALMFVVLSLAEEVIVGLVHGRKASDVATAFAGGTLPQLLASTLLMSLIMAPYFAFSEISAQIGEGKLLKILTGRRLPENT